MTAQPKLKPCPWCNGIADVIFELATESPGYMVICPSTDCPVRPRTNHYAEKVEAIAAWNKRA